MARINVAPTRSNLLRFQSELAFAQKGFDILDKKREVLTAELMRLAHDADLLQRQVWEQLEAAYRALEDARLNMGQERVEWAALAVNKTVEVDIRNRGVMGVLIPTVEPHGKPLQLTYSFGDTPSTLDEARIAFHTTLEKIPRLSEMMTVVWRLAGELRKNQRRVNALKHVFIPYYQDTILYIQSVLEEREREEIFRLKRLKSKKSQSSRKGGKRVLITYESTGK